MLSASALAKSYGEIRALDDVHLDVAAGEVLCLLGPNGAGKSTLISIIAGLLRPDAGAVTVADLDIAANPAATRRRTGLAPQDLGLYLSLTVRQNLRFFGVVNGVPRRSISTRCNEVARSLLITELLDRPVRTLSGGEKRRVHTAAALMHAPSLLLLDEPTVGADVETRTAILDVVRSLAADGAAICYCTHYLPEVEALDGTVAILAAGRIVERGSVAGLVARHGVGAVDVRFQGSPPAAVVQLGSLVEPNVLRITTDRPHAAVRDVVDRLAAEPGSEVDAIEIVRPSLDVVFTELIGEHAEPRGAGEVVDVGLVRS